MKKVKAILTPEEFEALPQEKKRVLVLKDVIEQVLAHNFIVKTGRYIKMNSINAASSSSAREALINNNIKCSVCARGGLFLSAVKFKNKLSVYDIDDTGRSFNYNTIARATAFLNDIYNMKEQAVFETIFEGDRLSQVRRMLDVDTRKKAVILRNKLRAEWKASNTKLTMREFILIEMCKYFIRRKGAVKL